MILDPAALVNSGISERIDLEYKSKLPERSDRDRFELLKDVSALANSGGGVIYFGVVENAGVATKLEAITNESFDDASRRLGQTLESGIEPRISGIKFKSFEVDSGYVLALSVPARLGSPCRAVQNGQSKFFQRSQNFVSEMTYDQLKQAFDRAGSMAERAKNRWLQRVQQVKSRKTWRPMVEGPVCLCRLTPLGINDTSLFNPSEHFDDYTPFMFSGWGGASRSFNLDGLIVYAPLAEEGKATALVQAYRDGTLDAMRYGGIPWQDTKVIPSQTVAEFFRECIFKFSKLSRNFLIPGPFIFHFAIIGVDSYEFGLGSRYFHFDRLFSDRDDLILPELYLESLSGTEERISKNVLDILWQCFGVDRCSYYDLEGNWTVK